MNFETENMEFKAQFTEEIYKEVIAFANTDGGIIYVGIDNNGNAIGLTDVDQEYTRITNGIRDAIVPDVTMFARFSIQDNKVVRITVSEGANKPYYRRTFYRLRTTGENVPMWKCINRFKGKCWARVVSESEVAPVLEKADKVKVTEFSLEAL